MSFRMPLDDNSQAVPCITLRDGKAHKITSATSAAAKNTTPFDEETVVISIYATSAVWIKFLNSPDDEPATANDHYYPAGVYYNFHLGGQVGDAYADQRPNKKYISVLGVDGTGTVYISECE
jgi:hypothetical protein